ncbi:MAG TPA: endonuclease MutS2 [Bryobacteraceae bacterium]|nr:endonuclease MutS2 [Bryobacteraceae bacterium]
MPSSTLQLLEYSALKQLIGRYVASPLGKSELERLQPLEDRSAAEARLADAAEARAYLDSAAKPQAAARGAAVRLRFGDLPDVAESIRRLHIQGAPLEAKQIFDLFGLLDRAGDIRSILLAVGDRFPKLSARGAAMGEFRSVVKDLAGKILPDGTVADHASVLLGRLRRDMERQRNAIHDSLERFLKHHKEELQEEFITIRNERFVVPIVAGQRRKVDGVIHGASGTGHTLFVEPLETIELNNELVRLTEEELQEVHRILLELTDRLRDYAGAIDRTLGILGELDVIFAKAQFAVDFGCTVPRFSPEGTRRLSLVNARHPLLEDVLRRKRIPVVPVSLTLEGDTRTLLISGPNSGGKTVTLKTAGILTLMAKSGLPVPAEAAEFPWFDQVLADIGDQQSIEASLSTFSAHMSRVREMLSHVTRDSLVLLDELGRATDPEEGGALGLAVLDDFRASGGFTLASTHLLALKIYGGTTPGVLNASMGFDEETLEPTYVLRLGAPGKSAGIDIAQRIGMPRPLLEKARASLSSRERDIARFLGELDRRLREVSEQQAAIEEERAHLALREKQVAEEWAKRESAKLKELERQYQLAVEKFEERAGETIDRIISGSDQKKAAQQALRHVAKAKREFREELDTTVLATRADAHEGVIQPLKIEEGSRVKLKGVREAARVRRVLSGGKLEVEAGFLKMQVSRDEVLEVLPEKTDAAKLPKNVSFRQSGPEFYITLQEVNVIGQRADEALSNVDKFLDSAMLASADRVRIVHGHGMGVLKRAIAEMLAKHPSVQKFYQAPQNEGGAGATIVELKE